MSRSDPERLSKQELIELVLKLHRPEKTAHLVQAAGHGSQGTAGEVPPWRGQPCA